MIEGIPLKHDKHGHCVSCHKNMKFKQIVDNKEIERFTPDYDEKTFMLTNGSKMRVAICKKCKLKDLDLKEIMDCVYRGWEVECEELVKDDSKPEWTKERKEKHLTQQSKLEILTHADNVPDDILLKKLKEHKELKARIK
jgi:hypothetical protein